HGRRWPRTLILVHLHHVRAVHLAHVARRTGAHLVLVHVHHVGAAIHLAGVAAGRAGLVPHFRHVGAAIHLAHVAALPWRSLGRTRGRATRHGWAAAGRRPGRVAAAAILVHLHHVIAAAGVVLAGHIATASSRPAPGVGCGDRATAAALLRIV